MRRFDHQTRAYFAFGHNPKQILRLLLAIFRLGFETRKKNIEIIKMKENTNDAPRVNAVWLERVKTGLFAHVQPYEDGMRRSVQSVM